MTLQEYQSELLKLLEEAVNSFQGELPFIENEIFRRIQLMIRDLEIKNGQILNTASNLRKIGQIRSEIQGAVLNNKYLKQVQEFVNAFNQIADIQKKYFSSNFDGKLPTDILNELQKQAKDAVVSKLKGAGLQANIVEQVQEILRKNITTGGSFMDLNFQMQEFMISEKGVSSKINAYATTATTDALNQFSAQYHDIITQDLGLDWFMYVGSNLATTREFCEYLTKKKYVHRSEIPEIIKGHIDGHNVKINPKTDLWYGAIEGTNVNNFPINRGGYRCGHQFIAVHESVVPKNIRDEFKNQNEDPYDYIPKKTLDKMNSGNKNNLPEELLDMMSSWGSNSDNIKNLHENNPDKKWMLQSVKDGVTQYDTIYRGMKYSKSNPKSVAIYKALKKLYTKNVGETIQFEKIFKPTKSVEFDNRLNSASTDKFTAQDFAGLKNDGVHSVVMTVKNSNGIRGIDAEDLTGHEEAEIIFGDEFQYKILDAYEEDGNLFISLDQITF